MDMTMPSRVTKHCIAPSASLLVVVGTLTMATPAAYASDDPSSADDSGTLPTVVIGTSPLPGATIDSDKIPSHVETVQASDLTRNGSASLTGALNSQLGSVNINDTLADPFQPDILYRG